MVATDLSFGRPLIALCCAAACSIGYADRATAQSNDMTLAPATPWNPPSAVTGSLTSAAPAGDDWGGQQVGAMIPRRAAASPTSLQPVSTAQLGTMTPPEIGPVRTASLATTTIPRGDETVHSSSAPLPAGTRDGAFQKALFAATWLPALSHDSDALGMTELDASVVFGFPMMRRDAPLLVTPQLNVNFLDNTTPQDLPHALFGAATEFRHLRKFGDGPWAMDVAATVGYYSDFETSSSDGVRVSGRGLAVYETSPSTQWILGAAYLNRAGASVLPVAGVIHQPTADTRWELIFPRPRLAWRTQGSIPSNEGWIYVGMEFGGGVWAVTHPSSGVEDLLQYSDYRLMAGYERKVRGQLDRRIEFGYVFNRELEFQTAPDVGIDDSLYARVGITY